MGLTLEPLPDCGQAEQSARKRERAALFRGFTYLRPHAQLSAAIIVVVIVRALLDLVPALLTKELIDRALPAHNGGLLNWLVGLMIISPTIYESLGVWQNYANAIVSFSVSNALRRDLYDRYLHMPLTYHVKNKSGEAMSKLMNDCDAMLGLLLGDLPILLRDSSKIVTTICIALVLNPVLTVTALLLFSFYVIPTRLYGVKLKTLQRIRQERLGSFTEFVRERLGASLLIRYSGTEDVEYNAFEKELQQVVDVQVSSALTNRLLGGWGGIIRALGTTAVFGLGGWMVIHGTTTIGTLSAFTVYIAALYTPIETWKDMYVDVLQSAAVLDRIFTAMDLPVEDAGVQHVGTKSVKSLKAASLHGERSSAQGRGESQRKYTGQIVFHNVRFRHDNKGPDIIHNMTFTCEPGEVIAFVGKSGAGKSTVLDLIIGLSRPCEGGILIDGTPLEQLDLQTLRRRTAVVSQDTLLWNDSLIANIRYGAVDAGLDDVIRACQDAQLHEWIEMQPDGYNTIVGTRGQQLSGGQRQRLSLARAFLRDPDMLLLDEATSALDTETERMIMESVRSRMAGRTIVIVAHRLSTVKAADRIYVMENGQIVERGTHSDLLERSGVYASLYEREEQASQFGAM